MCTQQWHLVTVIKAPLCYEMATAPGATQTTVVPPAAAVHKLGHGRSPAVCPSCKQQVGMQLFLGIGDRNTPVVGPFQMSFSTEHSLRYLCF